MALMAFGSWVLFRCRLMLVGFFSSMMPLCVGCFVSCKQAQREEPTWCWVYFKFQYQLLKRSQAAAALL